MCFTDNKTDPKTDLGRILSLLIGPNGNTTDPKTDLGKILSLLMCPNGNKMILRLTWVGSSAYCYVPMATKLILRLTWEGSSADWCDQWEQNRGKTGMSRILSLQMPPNGNATHPKTDLTRILSLLMCPKETKLILKRIWQGFFSELADVFW